MLRALELIGFKSFADKTRFEFPKGITVVVGPNGSGKSNIVDAIKWVLGEQSVKSLRGKEMADVIFNGSGTRRGLNSAEITLTLDNSGGNLEVDTSEVHITRRVYRSGEGEYLINRQPCRLRDIRDLLSGTGLGTQAYSVIEQGKVDVLLQSSPKDRRAIFEEAAGISRFKSKKLEAQRRLERVEQNLTRLSDIVDEVEARLRSIRLQAGKAKRYREYTARLQELRTQVGLADWTRLSDRLAQFDQDLRDLVEQRDGCAAEAESLEAQSLEAELKIGELGESIRRGESRMAERRERIASGESTVEHERSRIVDIEAETSRRRRQLATMSARTRDIEAELGRTTQAVAKAQTEYREMAALVADGERGLSESIDQLDQLRADSEQQRAAYLEQMRVAATLSNRIAAIETQLEAAEASRRQSEQRIAQSDQQLAALAAETDDLGRIERELDDERARCDQAEQEAIAQVDRSRTETVRQQAELTEMNQRRTGVAERASVLDELLRRHEGLSPGVRQVLDQSSSAPDGPMGKVCGLVADLFQVSVEAAMLIEVALGDMTQHLVVGRGSSLMDLLQSDPNRFSGRVGFLWMEPPIRVGGTSQSLGDGRGESGSSPSPTQRINLEGRPGVVGRADRFVETEAEYRPLLERLLGDTWIVERLPDAIKLAEGDGAGCRFVTLVGELLEADATVVVGPRHAAVGLISRRSEARALGEQLVDLDAAILATSETAEQLHQKTLRCEQALRETTASHGSARSRLEGHRHKLTAVGERHGHLARQLEGFQAELRAVATRFHQASQQRDEAVQRQEALQQSLVALESELSDRTARIEQVERERQTRHLETTDRRVQLAKSEERLENLQGRMRQFEESRQERDRTIGQSRDALADNLERARRARFAILSVEGELAELYLAKEAVAGEMVGWLDSRNRLQAERSDLASRAQRARDRARKQGEAIHAADLAANEIRIERKTLADRLREDYDIELAELEHEPTEEQQKEREEVQREIDDLRRKINNLGNINLEALEELDQIESRHEHLSEQYRDLNDAKNALARIIDKINVDSRRLFTETLDTVRGHFKSLFADLFGGGQADIMLDESQDILETGIEIVARPPGKELRSISLLSGGEKTLTCVALLLAMFRSRPSPFCVLDEVDAALDEANIDRFTNVLHNFLKWTQFIIVTHSKKTMTAASTIYGVTMQESGVSKRVSVRFEDVTETGEILVHDGGDDDDTQAA